MRKFVKAGLMLVLGLTLVAPGMTTPANAASKVKVVSTSKIAKKAYHGKKGYIYSSAKLTKKKHNMKNYKYTTWYGTKKATIKRAGKKRASLTYIKTGKKKGWIYSKYLTAGKAPINKNKKLKDDIASFNRAAMLGDSGFQYFVNFSAKNYEELGNSLGYDGLGQYNGSTEELTMTRKALLGIYDIFKGRFSKIQNANLKAMANDLENFSISSDNDLASEKLRSFAETLENLIQSLD